MSSIWALYAKTVTEQELALLISISLLVGVISPAPIIMRLRRKKVGETVERNYGVLNIFRTFGIVPGAVTALFDFAKVEVVMLVVFVVFRWNVDVAILAGCAVVSGHLLPWFLGRKGDTGSFPYLGLSLLLLQFPGVWLLVAALFLAGSVNCTVLFMTTFAVATPVFSAFYGYSTRCLVAIVCTSIMMLIVRAPSFVRVAKKSEPTIVDVLAQLYAIVIKHPD